MNSLSITILREAVFFLEICQEQVFNGKIPASIYFSLSDLKLKFIRNILEDTNKSTLVDNELDLRLEHVFYNDTYIHNYIIENKLHMA